MQLATALGLVLLVALAAALPDNWAQTYNRYKGYRVYEVTPKSLEQVRMLRKWMLEEDHFDFWTEPAKNLEPVHIMVNARQASRLTVKCRKYGLDLKVHIDDLTSQIDEFVAKQTEKSSRSNRNIDLDDFNTYEAIMEYLQPAGVLSQKCSTGGFTYTYEDSSILSVEGRAIPIVSICFGDCADQPVYVLDATVHAREWLTTATILKLMDHVCDEGATEDFVTKNKLVFLPVVNPDGYVYSWTNERLWRKNRAGTGTCRGVDLNRNFDQMWGLEGVSTSPCSDLYCGPSGNSEPETQALSAVLQQYSPNQRAYVTFHSYGNMWMHPKGNTVNNAGVFCERADDHDDMFSVAVATANAMEAKSGDSWARGTSCEVIYPTTGASDDYAKYQQGWKYPYNPELRGNGFIISPDQIQPSFEEVWAGLLAKESAIAENPPNN